jgi:hypothetical protein
MDHSKLGRRSPSLDGVRMMAARCGPAMQVVIDACQLRASPARLRWYLEQGWMVLITGSKFFTGPPFGGALLVPAPLAAAMAATGAAPPGLRDYTGRSDWPRTWHGVRDSLPGAANPGQFLRWSAALAEMHAYFAVPAWYRDFALRRFAGVAAAMIEDGGERRLLGLQAAPPSDGVDDAEMASPTIFPFLLRRHGAWLSPEECGIVHRALNSDISAILPGTANPAHRRLAAQPCHIGQPVVIDQASGQALGALRIAAGARLVSDTWSGTGPAVSLQRLGAAFSDLRTVLDKVELTLRHFDRLQAGGVVSR